MNINELITEIFSYGELNSITESLDPLFESLTSDVKDWFRADPNRLGLKKNVAFEQFLNDYPAYKSANRVNTDSGFGKARKSLLAQPIDPNTNTIAVPVKAETASSKIVAWIKANPTAKFSTFCVEFPEMNTASNRTIFNKARVALGLNKKPAPIVDEEETSDNNYDGIPLEDDEETTDTNTTTGKTLVTDFKGSPVASRTNVIHAPTGDYPVFDNKLGARPSTLYPKELISNGEVIAIRYYLMNQFNLTKDEINDFITNLIYDKKWAHQLNPDTQFDIIKDAVNGKKEAINLLFLACFQNIAYNYTAGPTPYLGIKVSTATDDDKTTYIGLAYQTLAGNFNPNSDQSGCSLHPKKGPLTCEDLLGKNEYPLINFGTRYSQLLQSAIREQLKIESFGGITGKSALSNKTSGTFQYVAATWKSENVGGTWDEFVSENPYAVWEKFYPGPISTEHSANNTELTDPNKIARRKLAFQKAYTEELKSVSYDQTAANMDLEDGSSAYDNEAFMTMDKSEQLSTEFLQDMNDIIHDEEYTDNVDILLQHILGELQAAEDFRVSNTTDAKYEAKPVPLTDSRYSTAKSKLGKLFADYGISQSEFADNVNKLSPKLVLNYIRNHK